MKLLFCKSCQDIIKMDTETRTCKCGSCQGAYTKDNLNAWYKGDLAVPMGFANNSLALALNTQPTEGMGKLFEAFIIPKKCPTFKKL